VLSSNSANTVIGAETLIVHPAWNARMRAVTPSGAYLLANRKMRVGSRLRLRISQGELVTLRVTRCATQPTGGWALTCTFEAQPDPEVLHTLKPAPSVLDQRQWTRLPCSTLVRFRPNTRQEEGMSWARLADISACGACLVTKPALLKGDVLELELGANKPVHALGRVTYARQQSPQAWIIGCKLEHGLAEDELWQLLSDVP
jgi:hypothetical protein